jgi:hypothetical protein
MTRKLYENSTLVINRVGAGAIRTFDAWLAQMGFQGRKDAFLFLMRAVRDNRLLVMDKLTREILVGDAREDTLLQARAAARHEARIVLYEEGFISDPGVAYEMVERVKP